MDVYPSVLESSKSNFSQWWPENSTPFLLYLWASFSPHIMRLLCTYRSDGNFWDAASSAMRPIICRDQLWFFRQIATQRVNWLRWYLDYISLVLAQCGKHQERFLSWSYRHSPIRFRETLSLDFFVKRQRIWLFWSLLKKMMAFLITKAVKRFKQHEKKIREQKRVTTLVNSAVISIYSAGLTRFWDSDPVLFTRVGMAARLEERFLRIPEERSRSLKPDTCLRHRIVPRWPNQIESWGVVTKKHCYQN